MTYLVAVLAAVAAGGATAVGLAALATSRLVLVATSSYTIVVLGHFIFFP